MKNVELNFMSRDFFFQLQGGEQAIVPAKQKQLFPDQLYLSDFKSNKFAGGKILLHRIFISHRKAPDMSKTGVIHLR